MISNRTIVCLASNWHYDPTSKHHVMQRLARSNHVVWVNYHGSRRPRATVADLGAAAAKIRQFVSGPVRVDRNLTVITPMVVPVPGSAVAAAVNRRLLVRQIRAVLRRLPRRPVQLWSFAPDVDYLCGAFDEEAVVYYCVDEFGAFTGYDRAAIGAAEARLAARANLVITTSRALYDAKRPLNPRVELVPHGVDVAHFSRPAEPGTPLPAEIAGIPRPILGFWGLLQDWLDLPLLAAVARARPNWSIVLIGEPATDVSMLTGLPNVHLLGRKPYALLPDYARAFDVGLIPFRINELTRAVNPIKLREYLCAGLPVVSTPLPEVEAYGRWARVAATPETFVEACAAAMAGARSEEAAARRAAMQDESWDAKVEVISRLVEDAIGQRGKMGIGVDSDSNRQPVGTPE